MHIQYVKILRRDPWFLFAALLAGLLLVILLAGSWLSPHDPFDISFTPLERPSKEHWLGTNDGGMDIWAELLAGLRNTVSFGLVAGLAGAALAMIAGVVAACRNGLTDHVLMRLGDILLALPSIMVTLLLAALFRPPAWGLACILALLAWPGPAKTIRAQTLALQGSLHVQAARHMGGSPLYILIRHILPELFPLGVIAIISRIRSAVFMEASLAFLGLLDPMRKSLGKMIQHGLGYYYLDIWGNWLLPPLICLCLLLLSLTLMGVSLEKLFDPRMRETNQ